MEFKDYYKILGVDRNADQKTISAAFRKLARQYHPDVNKAASAEERFKEINEAYQVLGDAERRARYDQMHEAYQRGGVDWQQLFGRGATQAPGGWTVTFGGEGLEDLLGGAGGFSEFFRQFFGTEVAGPQRRGGVGVDEMLRGQPSRDPVESSIAVTLEDAFTGARKSVAVRLDGAMRRFDVAIPRGVRSGQRIRLPSALDGRDLYLTVEVQPHPLFERRDDDVYVEVPVTAPEAVLGATIEVPTLEGKVEMTVPPGTQNGQTFRLRAQGMLHPDGQRGDQLVRVKVVLPAKPTAKEKQLFEALAKLRTENPRAHWGST